MDPHFSEYLGAIAGMRDIYGEHSDDHRTDFHEDHASVAAEEPKVPTVTVAAA